MAAAGILLSASGYLWLLGGGAPPPDGAAIGGPFSLTRGDGQVVTERDFRGRYLLLYFGYTSCRDVCPTTLSAVAAALAQPGIAPERVQPVFVTVDPERDTPAVVRKYVESFSPRLIGLTGGPEQIRAIEREYRVSAIVHPGPEGRLIDHSSVLYLIAPDGRFIAPIRADESGREMAADLARYLS